MSIYYRPFSQTPSPVVSVLWKALQNTQFYWNNRTFSDLKRLVESLPRRLLRSLRLTMLDLFLYCSLSFLAGATPGGFFFARYDLARSTPTGK